MFEKIKKRFNEKTKDQIEKYPYIVNVHLMNGTRVCLCCTRTALAEMNSNWIEAKKKGRLFYLTVGKRRHRFNPDLVIDIESMERS